MKNCPYCLRELPSTRKERAKKKWSLGYTVSATIPRIRSQADYYLREFWFKSGWRIPKSLLADNWDENPAFSRYAFEHVKGIIPEYYTVERKAGS